MLKKSLKFILPIAILTCVVLLWGFAVAVILVAGLSLGILIGAILNSKGNDKQRKFDEENNIQEQKKREAIAVQKRYETYANDSVSEYIKLKTNSRDHNVCYSNDEIFATFFIDKSFRTSFLCKNNFFDNEDGLKIKDINKAIKDGDVDEQHFVSDFYKILNSGAVSIFSKVEGEQIAEIIRLGTGSRSSSFYLPDGPLFFDTSLYRVFMGEYFFPKINIKKTAEEIDIHKKRRRDLQRKNAKNNNALTSILWK